MRIIAVLSPIGNWEKGKAVAELQTAFSRHSLIETDDPTESRDIIAELIADMSESARHRFQRTVRVVARHALDGTAASVSVLDNGQLLLRLRNPLLRQLVPNGHALLDDLLSKFGSNAPDTLRLTLCEIREKGGGHSEGFLFGEWRAGDTSLLRFFYGQRKAYFYGVTLLFLAGLFLVVLPTFLKTSGPLAELGLRLGAPMLVSSSVVMLERLSFWLAQRTPSLKWTPIRHLEINSPLQGTFDPSGF